MDNQTEKSDPSKSMYGKYDADEYIAKVRKAVNEHIDVYIKALDTRIRRYILPQTILDSTENGADVAYSMVIGKICEFMDFYIDEETLPKPRCHMMNCLLYRLRLEAWEEIVRRSGEIREVISKWVGVTYG